MNHRHIVDMWGIAKRRRKQPMQVNKLLPSHQCRGYFCKRIHSHSRPLNRPPHKPIGTKYKWKKKKKKQIRSSLKVSQRLACWYVLNREETLLEMSHVITMVGFFGINQHESIQLNEPISTENMYNFPTFELNCIKLPSTCKHVIFVSVDVNVCFQ